MNITYNISFSIASIFIVTVLILIVSLNYSSSNIVNKRFKYFLFSSLIMFVLDIITVITNDNPGLISNWLNSALNSFYFLITSCVALLFLYYCVGVAYPKGNEKYKKYLYVGNLILLFVQLVTLVLNGFFGFYFYFDEALKYTHGPLYNLINLVSLIFVIESFIVFFHNRKSYNRRQVICTTIFFAAFFLSFGLQLFVFPNVLLSDFGSAMGSLIVFFSIETPDYVKLVKTLEELRRLKATLEEQVEDRTKQIEEEKQSYVYLLKDTLSSLARLIDAKDHYTQGHSFRVASYAKAVARKMGFEEEECNKIYFAGLVHDVGKIGISETILRKPSRLEADEFEIIKSHTKIGGDILSGIKKMKVFEDVARYHHERYDGGGYPDQIKETEIPLEARIVTVCDSFDAMTSDRSYRKALSDEYALNELIRGKGSQFDPDVVSAFISVYNEFEDSIVNHIDDLI